jgi:predicted dehydrogenase
MTPSPDQRILRVLHVGVGNRGVWPLTKCTADTGFVPTLLCDVSPANLRSARELTGLPESACFTDAARAIAHGEVDCVIGCVPTIFHVPLAKQAIAAGLPVLIEKGMAPDWPSAQDLAQAVARVGAVAAVAQNYRYGAVERTIRAALRDPTHPAHPGDVHLVLYTQNRVRPEPRTLTYPFASVWDMSCHHFDTLLD